MTDIYVVRHAEAEGNLYRRIQGHFDGGVTQRGRRQIEALAERFRALPLDAVYSSDLTRAYETALGLAEPHGLRVTKVPALREMNLGAWENRTWGEVEHEDAEGMRCFTYAPDEWSVEGGESFCDLTARITGAVRELANKHKGGTIAIVTHGMAIRSLLCAALGVSAADHRAVPHGDNTSVARLHVEDGEIYVEYFNDNSHLPEEISTFARQVWWREKTSSQRNNLRFVPLDPYAEPELYIDCYRDAWIASHGTDRGFTPDVYLRTAKRHARENPLFLVKAMRGDVFSGVVELDPRAGEKAGAGWITLLYLVPAERSRNLATQLIGHAVTVFRAMGRRGLRLHVSQDNEHAIGFYKHIGFKMIGVDEGVLSPLCLMEKSI